MSGIEPLIASSAIAAPATTAVAAELGVASSLAAMGGGTGLIAPATMTGTGIGLASMAPEIGLGTGITGVASASPAFTAPFAASMAAPLATAAGIELGTGLIPFSGAAQSATSALAPMQALRTGMQGAQLLSPGGKRSAYSPAPMNKGRQVDLASPVLSLLEAQPMRRRKEPLSLI